MLSASLVTLTWGVFDAGIGFVAGGTNQTHFLVPNGGWLTMANLCIEGDTWTEGGGTVRLLALRGEDEVVLAEAELDFENRQVTLLERAQLLPGDRLHAEVEWTDAPAPNAEVIGNVTACFGLFRYLTG